MKTWVRRSLNVGVLGAGFLLVGGGAAHADQVSGPNAGIVSGNQLSSVLQMPIDVSGNAISVAGFADAASVGGAGAVTESAATTEAGQVSGFNSGILSGNQVSSVVQVPVSVCGNSIAVLGFANAQCVGGAGAVNGGGGWSNGGWDHDGDGQGNGGSYGGGQGMGNYGGGSARGNYGGANAKDYDAEHGKKHHGGMGSGSGMGGGSGALSNGGADQVTGYNAGLVTGNQISSVIQAPIDVSGNAVALFGFANARSVGGSAAMNESASTTEAGQVSGFNAGILSGNQLSSVIQVPVSVCGNAIAVLGFANAQCVGGAAAVNGGGGWDNDVDWDTPADEDPSGTPSGNYDYADPASARPSGMSNSAAKATKAAKAAKKAKKAAKATNEHGKWAGHGKGNWDPRGNSNGYGGTGSSYGDGSGYGNGHGSGHGSGSGAGNGGSFGGNCGPDQVTGYNAGLLSGNQVSSVVQLPIDISGNAISLFGFANAQSVGGAAAVNC